MADNQEAGRKRPKMSKVWEHFLLRKEDNVVQCIYCLTDLAYHHSTSSMLQHLTRKHPHLNSSPSVASTRPQDHGDPIQSELLAGTTIFRTRILSLMEAFMVRTTSEIVSIFDEIYMGAETKLMQKRKEVEALTERLKEREQLCALNVCHNLPDVKVERGQELLESVLFYGQSVPEMTETVEFPLECVVQKAEGPIKSEPVALPCGLITYPSIHDEALLGAPVGAAEGAESAVPPVGQPHQMKQGTTRSAATAGQGSSVAAQDSASVRQNLVLNGAPESDQAAPPAVRRRGRPPECMVSSSSNISPYDHSAEQEPLSRADEELLGSPVEEEEGAESALPPVGQPHQMKQETTRSAATAGQGFSVRQNLVANGAPESDQAAPPAGRRRGRSAGTSSVSLCAPGTTLDLRGRSAAVSTNSRPHETLEGLDSFPCVDAPGTKSILSPRKDYPFVVVTKEEDTDDCLSSESEIENPADMDVKYTAVMRETENSEAIENPEDGYQQGEEDMSLKRRSAVKSEKIPRKKTKNEN